MKTITQTKGLPDLKKLIKDTADFIGEKYQLHLEKAKKELDLKTKEAVDEKNKLMIETGELKYENQVLTQQVSMFKRKLKMGEISYADLTRELLDAQKELKTIEKDSNTLKKSYEAAQDYIKTLEAEIFEYEQVLKHFPKAKIATVSKQATDSERKEKRALNEIHAMAMKNIKDVKGENFTEASTLTEIFGTGKTLSFVEETFVKMYKDQEILVQPEISEQGILTESNGKQDKEISTDIIGEIENKKEEIMPEIPKIEEKKQEINKEITNSESQTENSSQNLSNLVVNEEIIFENNNNQNYTLDLNPDKKEEKGQKSQISLGRGSSRHSGNRTGTNFNDPNAIPNLNKDTELNKSGKISLDNSYNNPYTDTSPIGNTKGKTPDQISHAGSKVAFSNETPQNIGTPASNFDFHSNIGEAQNLMQLIENVVDIKTGELLNNEQKEKAPLKEIEELAEPPTFDKKTLQKMCPYCRKLKKNPRRPIIKVAPFNIHGLEHLINRKLGVETANIIKYDKCTQTEKKSFFETEQPIPENEIIEPPKSVKYHHQRSISRSEARSKRRIIKDLTGEASHHRKNNSEVPSTSVLVEATESRPTNVKIHDISYETLEKYLSGSGCNNMQNNTASGKKISKMLWKQKHSQELRRRALLSREKQKISNNNGIESLFIQPSKKII